jgi:hypothetical protein
MGRKEKTTGKQPARRNSTPAIDERNWWVSRLKGVVERCMQAEAVMDRKGEWTGHYQFDASAALKGLEMLGKHYGLFQLPPEPDGQVALNETDLDDEIMQLMRECGYAPFGEGQGGEGPVAQLPEAEAPV